MLLEQEGEPTGQKTATSTETAPPLEPHSEDGGSCEGKDTEDQQQQQGLSLEQLRSERLFFFFFF